MAKDYERQHYLTESYLKGFVDKSYEGFVVWQYRKSTGQIRQIYTKEAAVGEYLHSMIKSDIQPDDHDLEHQFSKVERFFVPLSRKVLEYIEAFNLGTIPSNSFTPRDRLNIIEFVIIHMIRVPSIRNWINLQVEQHHERMRAKGLLRFGETRAHNIEVRALVQIYGEIRPPTKNLLHSRHTAIEFSVRARNSVFTCDNPVMQCPPGAGIAHNTTQVLFPLNRRSFIRFFGSGDELRLMERRGSERIDWFNKQVIESASDEVYASDAQQLRKTLHEMGRSASIVMATTKKFRKRG